MRENFSWMAVNDNVNLACSITVGGLQGFQACKKGFRQAFLANLAVSGQLRQFQTNLAILTILEIFPILVKY